MSSTGNIFPTVNANVDRAASGAWNLSTGNVFSDNAPTATGTTGNVYVSVPADYLVTSGYGFALPAHATIVGVTVRVEAAETGGGSTSYIAQLHSATTPTLIGSAKSAVTVNSTTATVYSSGGTSDLWGATLTPLIVNNAGFGVSIWSTDTSNVLYVDYVTIAIEYTPFPTASVVSKDLQARNATVALTLSTKVNPADTVMSPLGLVLPVRTYTKDIVAANISATVVSKDIASYSASLSQKISASWDFGPLGLPLRPYTFPPKEPENVKGTVTSGVSPLLLSIRDYSIPAKFPGSGILATSRAFTVSAGQLTLTYTFSVDAVDALVITDYSATVRAHYSVAATAVSLDLAALGGGASLIPVFGAGNYALNLTEHAASILAAIAITAQDISEFTVTGNAATIGLLGTIAATLDTFTLTERAASVNVTEARFSGTIPDISVRKNSGIHTFDFGAYFENTTLYAIAPSLPSGMTLDTATGILTIDSNVAAVGKTDGYVVTGS
jgi:hypothetical protein